MLKRWAEYRTGFRSILLRGIVQNFSIALESIAMQRLRQQTTTNTLPPVFLWIALLSCMTVLIKVELGPPHLNAPSSTYISENTTSWNPQFWTVGYGFGNRANICLLLRSSIFAKLCNAGPYNDRIETPRWSYLSLGLTPIRSEFRRVYWSAANGHEGYKPLYYSSGWWID